MKMLSVKMKNILYFKKWEDVALGVLQIAKTCHKIISSFSSHATNHPNIFLIHTNHPPSHRHRNKNDFQYATSPAIDRPFERTVPVVHTRSLCYSHRGGASQRWRERLRISCYNSARSTRSVGPRQFFFVVDVGREQKRIG